MNTYKNPPSFLQIKEAKEHTHTHTYTYTYTHDPL
jgi:hypothetical protein